MGDTQHPCPEHSGVVERLDQHEQEISSLFKAVREIEKALASRLPLWATFLIAGLSTAIGILARGMWT